MDSALLELALEAPPVVQANASTPEPIPVQEACGLCEQALVYVAGKHDAMYVILAILEDGSLTWAHKACVMLKSKRPTISESVPRRMPACSRCNASFYDHMHSSRSPHTVCATVDLQEYLPAEPIRSRHWPFRVLSPEEYAQGVVA